MKMVVLVGLAVIALSAYAVSDQAVVQRAAFTGDGHVDLPQKYRQWVHVGTRYKTTGTNFLDGSPLTSPQFLDAYVEPGAFTVYKKSGQWPDGTQIVKEFSEIRTGLRCDPTAHVCATELGDGIFQANYSGLAMMVKDKRRYPASVGNWAYFGFGHQAPPYQPTAQAMPAARCAACHDRNAAKSDSVFVHAHIDLDSVN